MGKISALLQTTNKYNGLVTAIATIVLAGVTYLYLVEVREQRKFSYQQLALQNLPELEIFSPEPFQFDNLLRSSVKFHNFGGIITDLRAGIVLLCGVPVEQIVDNVDKVKVIVWGARFPRINRSKGKNRFIGIVEEERTWLEPMLKGESRSSEVYAYIRADYMSPANTFQGPVEYSDSASFWWNPKFKKFMTLSDEGHNILAKVVTLKGSLKEMNSIKAKEPE